MRFPSNEVQNKVFSQGASKLPEVKDLDSQIFLIKVDYLGCFFFTFGGFDVL